MDASEIRVGRRFRWRGQTPEFQCVGCDCDNAIVQYSLLGAAYSHMHMVNTISLDMFVRHVIWLDDPDQPSTQRCATIGKCRYCPDENEYQTGPYVCGSCRAWGKK